MSETNHQLLSNNDSIRLRMRLLALFLVPIAIGLGVRLYFVQIDQHEEYLEKARSRYTTTKITTGKRGEIYDVNGNLLVSNTPCFHITCDPANITTELQRKKLAFILSNTLKIDYNSIYRKLEKERQVRDKDNNLVMDENGKPKIEQVRYVIIAKNVSLEDGNSLRKQLAANKIRAIFMTEGHMRSYPKGRLLSNVLGFTSVDNESDIAVLGLEKFFNHEMTAAVGKEKYERSRDGRPLNYGLHEQLQESRDGSNIYLTISEPIQAILEEELDAAVEKWRPQTIYAAIADPKTGNILAMAQRPTFDPNDRSEISPEAWRTRIIEDGLEPGSIIKPFTIGKALDWGVVTPNTTVDCEHGAWVYMNKVLRDSHPYDTLTVSGIIQKSSNVGTAKVALMLGEDKVYNLLRSFGFGQRTGIPLKPENIGIFPPVKRWDGLSITRFPIGYGILVSPMQMLRGYCALANNGKLPKLRLVDRVENPATGEIKMMPIEPPVQTFDRPETCATLVRMMEAVTQEGGTATKASIPGFKVAGKTGTSRKYVKGVGYAAGKYFASFAGFVPAENPAFVMIVTMDEPRGAYYGGTVSAPVFQAIAKRVLRYMNIDPDPSLMTEKEKKDAQIIP